MSKKLTVAILLFAVSSVFSLSKEQMIIVFNERINTIAHFYVDEVEAIYKRIGLEADITSYPEARALHIFRNSKADAIGGKIEEYELYNPAAIKINVPIFKNLKFKSYVLKKDFERVKNLKDPFIITSAECLGCIEFAKKHKIKISSYFKKMETGLKLLKLKRADIIISSEVALNSYSNDLFISFDNKVFESNLYHYISKKKAHLKDKLELEFKNSVDRSKFSLSQIKIFK